MQPLQIPKMVLIRYNFKINPKQQKVTKLQNVSGNEMKVTLTKGKKYYVRVRSYTKSGSTTVYGKWSSTKSVTIKK